ncbi:MAG: histidine phosphatase family protein [Acidimicrobiales bacterium]
MPRLLLLRHGQSTWNAEERWQGWADPPLSPLGVHQAEDAARWLVESGTGFGTVACSDLVRARRTAEIVADGLGLGPVEVDPALRERNVGDWEGLTTDEIGLRWPEALAAWRDRRLRTTPGGEAEPVLVARALAGLGRLAAAAPTGGRVLVVTHGGVIRSLERHFGLGPGQVANLCGRWFAFDGHVPVPGEVATYRTV